MRYFMQPGLLTIASNDSWITASRLLDVFKPHIFLSASCVSCLGSHLCAPTTLASAVYIRSIRSHILLGPLSWAFSLEVFAWALRHKLSTCPRVGTAVQQGGVRASTRGGGLETRKTRNVSTLFPGDVIFFSGRVFPSSPSNHPTIIYFIPLVVTPFQAPL